MQPIIHRIRTAQHRLPTIASACDRTHQPTVVIIQPSSAHHICIIHYSAIRNLNTVEQVCGKIIPVSILLVITEASRVMTCQLQLPLRVKLSVPMQLRMMLRVIINLIFVFVKVIGSARSQQILRLLFVQPIARCKIQSILLVAKQHFVRCAIPRLVGNFLSAKGRQL